MEEGKAQDVVMVEHGVLAWEVLANLCHVVSVRELAFRHELIDVLHMSLLPVREGESRMGCKGGGHVYGHGAGLGSGGRLLSSLFRCLLVLSVTQDSRGRLQARNTPEVLATWLRDHEAHDASDDGEREDSGSVQGGREGGQGGERRWRFTAQRRGCQRDSEARRRGVEVYKS